MSTPPAVPLLLAWKKHEVESHLTPCEVEDKAACHFEISYYAHDCGFSGTVSVTDKFLAEQIQRAMMNHYISGRKAAMADLRQLIGAKEK